MSLVDLTVLASEAQHRELPIPPLALGVSTFVVLWALLVITWQFNRHR